MAARDLSQELEQSNFQLNHRLVQMEALYQSGLVLSASLDSEELRGNFLRLAVGTVDARCGFLFLRDETQSSLGLAEDANFSTADLLQLAGVELHACMEEALATQEPQLRTGDKMPTPFPGQHLLLAPLGGHGCLGVVDKETREGLTLFNEMDSQLLEMMGQQAGMALSNARLFRQMAEERNVGANILNSVGNGVVSTDLRGNVARINPSAERILGGSADELVGQSLMQVFRSADCPLTATAILQTLASGEPQQVREESGGDSSVVLRVQVTPLLTAAGKVKGAVLAMEDLTERTRLETMFKQYASDQVVDILLEGENVPSLCGEVCEATMPFLDTVGSTELLGKIGGEEMVALMNEAYTGLVEIVFNHHGTLDKYTGDGFMAALGAPLSQVDDNRRAVLCALEIIDEMEKFNKSHMHRLDIKGGLSRGRVVAGNIGSLRRMEYSVIGPDVNLAALLCD